MKVQKNNLDTLNRFFYILLILSLIGTRAFSQEEDIDVFLPDVSYDLIQDRLSCIENTVPLVFNTRVQSFVDYFTVRNREYTQEMIAKKGLFFPVFEQILERNNLPDELKYLSIIESGLNPNAMSRVGAGGLWQFMPATGKSYGLKQSWYIDERMNPSQSTEAAVKYLKQLYNMFGDWELALAAYNTGPGNVRKAIRRSGYKKTFWGIYRYLPRETRSYVPQFVAMIYAMNYAEEHYFDVSNIDSHWQMDYDTLQVSNYIHLETLASQANICMDDIIKLNPQIIRGAIPDGVIKYPLKLPIDQVEFVRENRLAFLDSASKVGKVNLERLAKNVSGSTYGRTRQIHRVRSGDVLGTIAEQYHVRVSDLRKWNKINGNMIYAGQRLNIWVLPSYHTNVKKSYVAKKVPKPKPIDVAGGTYHTVQSGDSLWSIAQLYKNVSIDQLKKLNKLSSSRIDPGQKLLINM